MNEQQRDFDPVDEDTLLANLLTHLPVVVGVVRPDGEIAYATSSIEDLLGRSAAEVTGSSAFDHVHPDDHQRMVESLGFASNFNHGVMGPQRFRYRDRYGGWSVAEAWTYNAVDDPAVGGIVTVIEDRTLSAGLEEVQGGLTAGTPTIDILEDVARALRGHPIVAHAFFDGPDGPLISSALPGALGGTSEGPSPWRHVLRSGEPLVLTDLEELPVEMRSVAAAEGFTALWAYPVELPRHARIEAVLVMWRQRPGLPSRNQEAFVERSARIASLAFGRDRYERELRHAATHDPLTDIPNRTRLIDLLERGVGRNSALLYIDLDGFKPVNDVHGHGVGDEVLKVVGSRLVGAIRPGDHVSRLGGDEFAAVCQGISDREQAHNVAARLIERISRPMVVRGHRVEIGASIGIAWCPSGLAPAVRLIDVADRAMYDAKSAGRARAVLVEVST